MALDLNHIIHFKDNGLVARYATAEAMYELGYHKHSEWISIEDRLPEEKINCLVYYKHAYCNNDRYWAIGISFYDGSKFQIDWAYNITHWMPLPEPPVGKEN